MSELSAWKQLSAEVESGNLKLKVHKDAMDAAIKGLQDFIDHLDTFGPDLKTVENVTGFGGFDMGIQLAQKFTVKGSGDDSINQRVKELIEEAKAAQDVIRKAAKAYADTDEESARYFNEASPENRV